MKHFKFAVLVLLSLNSLPAFAQFTIKDTREAEVLPPVAPTESITIKPEYKWDYVNEAMKQELKRRRRKERNYVELTGRLKFDQSTFDNWAAGGDNNMNISTGLDFKHTYKVTKFTLESTVNAKYGLNYIESESFKNQDEFKVNVKTSWSIHPKWSYSMNGNLRSQFAPGYKNRTEQEKKNKMSDFMSPGYLTLSAGLTYRTGPLVFLFSPVGGDARFVLDEKLSAAGAYGVEKGKRSKWQAGPSIKINYDQWVVKDAIQIKSEMYSFTNLQSSPNFRWDATIHIRTLKMLETTLTGEMRYDELATANNVKANSMQYRTYISFGLAYTIKNK